MFSIPLISLCFPGFSLERLISFAKDLYRISLIKVDFPEPETPVTQTNCPKGIRTLIFFRLFSFAPIISMYFLLLFLIYSSYIFMYMFWLFFSFLYSLRPLLYFLFFLCFLFFYLVFISFTLSLNLSFC